MKKCIPKRAYKAVGDKEGDACHSKEYSFLIFYEYDILPSFQDLKIFFDINTTLPNQQGFTGSCYPFPLRALGHGHTLFIGPEL